MTIVVLGLDVRDVEEAIAADREIDESGLYGRFEIDDLALVDIPGVAFVARALDIQLLENAVFNNSNTALLGLQDIDQHFFFHAVSFRDSRGSRVRVRLHRSSMEPGLFVPLVGGGLLAIFPFQRPGNAWALLPSVAWGDLGPVSLCT
jgi:hypothetical protein